MQSNTLGKGQIVSEVFTESYMNRERNWTCEDAHT